MTILFYRSNIVYWYQFYKLIPFLVVMKKFDNNDLHKDFDPAITFGALLFWGKPPFCSTDFNNYPSL